MVWTGAIMMNPSGEVPSLTNMLFQLWTTPWCKRPHIGVVVLISFLHARAHTILVRRLSLPLAIPRWGRLKQNYPASGSPQAIACYTWPICPATAVNAATSTPVPGVLVPMRRRPVPSLSCGPASNAPGGHVSRAGVANPLPHPPPPLMSIAEPTPFLPKGPGPRHKRFWLIGRPYSQVLMTFAFYTVSNREWPLTNLRTCCLDMAMRLRKRIFW